ncbi:MAG: FAD-dependent oxidoreductase [Deltaproteobacteria bacterium]|nr:FAD-dependent oxidoreductase [Deltaproteobacteria bacterium]
MTRQISPRVGNVDAIIPISRVSTEAFKTGQWSPRKPSYREKSSPCREACPAGNNIPAMLSYAAKGDFDSALASLLQENPLPGVCGRVCYHPCQTKCNRNQFDETVEIRALERAIADLGKAIPPISSNPEDRRTTIAVIGSGPAGLSAAYFLRLFGHKVTIFESRREAGGVLRHGIPEYRLPKDVLSREIDRMLALGIAMKTDVRIDRDGLIDLQNQFDYIFLGTGAWLPQKLGTASEEGGPVLYGLDFLSHEGKKDLCRGKKNIVIIGGGDVAVDVARTARRFCSPEAMITMIAPEKEDDFPAISEGIGEAHEEGIRIIGEYRPKEFLGKERLEQVRLAKTRVEKDPATGRYTLSQGEGDDFVIDADLVIVAIGQIPDAGHFLPEIVDKDSSKVIVDNLGMTPSPGVYAGGDVIRQRPAVVDAILSGKRAALSIHLKANGYDAEKIMQALTLGQGSSLSMGAYMKDGTIDLKRVVEFADLNTLLYRKAKPNVQAKSPPETRKGNFREVNEGLDRQAAIDEAKRCFYCGSCIGCDLCFYLCPDISIVKEGDRIYSVKTDYCKGCSICATVCPRHVIEVEDRL